MDGRIDRDKAPKALQSVSGFLRGSTIPMKDMKPVEPVALLHGFDHLGTE
jgi:hypothetical protein